MIYSVTVCALITYFCPFFYWFSIFFYACACFCVCTRLIFFYFLLFMLVQLYVSLCQQKGRISSVLKGYHSTKNSYNFSHSTSYLFIISLFLCGRCVPLIRQSHTDVLHNLYSVFLFLPFFLFLSMCYKFLFSFPFIFFIDIFSFIYLFLHLFFINYSFTIFFNL